MLTAYLVTTWFCCGLQPVEPHVESLFAERNCHGPCGEVRYRYYEPPSTELPHPLLIWFHGRGEAGDNNRDQLAWLELWLAAVPRAVADDCSVLAVQCPHQSGSWLQLSSALQDPLDRVEQAYRDVVARGRIDRCRVYVAGVSQGATGCWSFARRHPQQIAGILPLGLCESFAQIPDTLLTVPTWVFQSRGDGPRRVREVGRLVQDAVQRQGSIRLSVVESDGHDCWTQAFQVHGATDWLLSQRLEQRGHDRWHEALAVVGRSSLRCLCVGGLAFVGFRHWRRSLVRRIRDS